MDMKGTLGVFLSVVLATLSLLTVPLGFATIAFNPIGGIVITVVGGLMMSFGVILDRWIDQPRRKHRC